ncbi:MAG: hypothetical protein ACR2PZ_08335 [Pseudomonadales bacterium]
MKTAQNLRKDLSARYVTEARRGISAWLKPAVFASAVCLMLINSVAAAAVITPTISVIDQNMYFSGSGFSAAADTGDVSFLDRADRPLGTFASQYSAAARIWDTDLPPVNWVSISIEDMVTTTLSSSELSISTQGQYRLERPNTGISPPASIGLAHIFRVVFEVELAPVTAELFFAGDWTQGYGMSRSVIELQEWSTRNFIAHGNNRFIVEDASGRSSRAPDSLTLELQPGLYLFQAVFSNIQDEIGTLVELTPRFYSGIRFSADATVPEPETLILLLSALLLRNGTGLRS